jgi:K(+)-stimulated pyrophosphate-energized sodium pump
MSAGLMFALVCAVAAIAYGWIMSQWILAQPAGNDRMKGIAAAIQEGAQAYLNRQYTTIGIVGAVLAVAIWCSSARRPPSVSSSAPCLSGAAGYIGMNVSVRANVRTAQAAPSASTRRSTSPSRAVPSPACWWLASACWASPATTPC